MLKRYKNSFLESIRASGFDVADFEANERVWDERPALDIRYRPQHELAFVAQNAQTDPHLFACYHIRYAPGFLSSPAISFPESGFATFPEILPVFNNWLSIDVRSAVNEEFVPDLWAIAYENLKETQRLRVSPTDEFTPEERRLLKESLVTFRLLVVENYHPDTQQLILISERLKYLEAAVDRLNRFDWKGVAISTLLSIAITLSLDTERGRQLYILFKQALSGLLHLLN